jgi:hypothetical protein
MSPIRLDAVQLSRAWLAVAQASGKDKDRPAFDHTVRIDQFTNGVRLSATDSYMVLTAWVPEVDDQFAADPLPDEIPYASAAVIDRHGRAMSLYGYLHKLLGGDNDDVKGLEVHISLNVPWQPDDTPAGDLQIDGFEALAATFEIPDQERLQLEVFEGMYPSLQALLVRQRNVRTDALAINPELAGRLVKASKVFCEPTLKLWFGGKDKPIQVAFGDEPQITGLVMPCSWNFATDAPYGEAAAGADPNG